MKLRSETKLVEQLGVLRGRPPFQAWLENAPTSYLYLSDLSREDSQMLIEALEANREKFRSDFLADTIETAIRFLKFSLKLPDDPQRFPKISRLEHLPPAIGKLVRTMKRGWVYQEELGVHLPYLITSAQYKPGNPREEQPAETVIRLQAYGQSRAHSVSIRHQDLKGGKSVVDLLAANGFVLETDELNAEHDRVIEVFDEYRRTDYALFDLLPHAQYRDNYWLTRGTPITGQFVLDLAHAKAERHRNNVTEKAPTFDLWEEDRCLIPTHPYLHGFLLSQHTYADILASQLKPHPFRKQAGQIVLAPIHRRLIDVLTGHLNVLGDIVDGKNEGTTILALGAPGLGKTLTAEIYAEETERPLYKVQSGQLGTSTGKIEENLKKIFERAARWNAVLLIDEADTYIRERGSDIEQNAIVATFLRAMEYFSGLLFMTSNRLDIDDAILSRASAIIEYQPPSVREREQLWRLHAANLQAELPGDLAGALAARYATSGRDVLNLLKLALRVARKEGVPLSLDLFDDLAPFKKISMVEEP